MVIFLEIVLFISLFFIVMHFVKKFLTSLDKKIVEAQCVEIAERKMSSLKKIEKKLSSKERYSSYLDRVEARLLKYDNPYNLSPVAYLMIKIIGGILVLSITMITGYNLFSCIALSTVTFFSIDILYYISGKDDRKKVIKDLPDICDILIIQNSAGVDLGLSLTEVYDIPKLKRLRQDLAELAAEINISKNPSSALDTFIKKYQGFYELETFVVALKQALQTGKSKEILYNQSEILKEMNLASVDDDTKKIDSTTVLLLSLLLFSGTILMIVFSLKIQLSGSLFQIFG